MASGFICYDSYLRKTRNLSDGALGKLFRALMSYHITGEIPEMDESVSVAFDFIREDLDDGDEKYKARCETNRQNRLSTKKSVSEEDTGSEISEVSYNLLRLNLRNLRKTSCLQPLCLQGF